MSSSRKRKASTSPTGEKDISARTARRKAIHKQASEDVGSTGSTLLQQTNEHEPLHQSKTEGPTGIQSGTKESPEAFKSDVGFEKGGAGSGGKRKPTTSRMKQPSLIKQIQGILSDYPDGGQIIKELIQNAEDAGASTVKIMYDARNINNEPTSHKYRKFLQGPALFLYNDATFTDLDWEGIKMIYKSVKENDKLKVGRFGLGFKSVFHITDNPGILSENKLLLINPHEHLDEVNTEFEVDQLVEYDDFNKEEFVKAFGGRFNIGYDTLTNGRFQGTIFRFPLRQKHSRLSDNIYTEEKVLDLFDSFKKEASDILLFLKNIASINITIQRGEQQFHEVATVELVENVDEVQNEKKRFKHVIEGLGSNYNGQPVDSFVQMNVQTTIHTQSQQMKKNTEIWLVVNYFMGNNASPQFQKLIQDKNIGYSPYVGVAAPLIQQTGERFEGHEFCFLPLPREGRRQTGLPFHVNGFFSLSSNRHHIKWPTNEQKGSHLTDKNILWNQHVIREAVPLAYKILVKNAIKTAKARDPSPTQFTQIVPLYDTTTENWQPFLKYFFDVIKDLPFLKVYGRHKWVTVSEACFATFRDLELSDSDMKDQIVSTLLELQQPFVNISSDSFNTLHHFNGGIKDLDPCRLANLLRNDMKCTYRKLPVETKLCILRYVLSEANYDLVGGLELIPLASGGWTTFVKRKTSSKNILLQLEAYKQMTFPDLEDNFVEIPDSLLHHFREICDREMYNLKYQTDDDTVLLLAKLLSAQGSKLTEGSTVNLTWLEKVWMHFRSAVDKISHLPLVPLLREGTWEKPVRVELIKLNQMAIFKTSEGHEPLSDGLSYCLEKLSVTVLPSHPRWFPVLETSRFISQPSQHSVLKILEQLVQTNNINDLVERFNRHCSSPNLINDFCTLMTNSELRTKNLMLFLEKLQLFFEKENDQGDRTIVSLESSSHRRQFISDITFPIRYPKPYIIAGENDKQLLKKLGVYACQQTDLVELTLHHLMSDEYSEKERVIFMKYFQSNFGMFESSQDIINLAKTVKFVKCAHTPTLQMPSDIFDPSESLLKQLFTEDMFPEDTRPHHLVVLKKLGLKSVSDIGADDVKAVAVSLDSDSKQHTDTYARATALLGVLNKDPTLLDQLCTSGRVLKSELEHLQWVPVVKTQPDMFPKCIPWYTHSNKLCTPKEARNYTEWYKVIGSTMPTITGASDSVSRHFGWNEDPPIEKVVQQLGVLSNEYNKKYHSEIVLIIKSIYKFLNVHKDESKLNLYSKDLVWCGDRFVNSSIVVLEKHDGDIDLEPYFFFMQQEFSDEFHELFEDIGCHVEQDMNVLVNCLREINLKSSIEENLHLVISILKKIELRDEKIISSRISEILIPVKTSEGIIVLKPPYECVFTDDEDMYDEEDDGDFLFVHESVTTSMVKAFKIKSLTRHVLDEAEGLDVEEWGQEEPLTTRLNSLLREGYKDGLSVPKELVQNADDAKATTVKILFDERENRGNTTRLLNKGMAQCQGPALWFYNDAAFTEEDFANIIKLNGATKKGEMGKIGKFGLGFCSVYNLTDVPSLFSDQTFVFLDPHMTYVGDALPGMSPGMKINLRNQRRKVLLRKYRDQFMPFHDVFGCSFLEGDCSFKGTLFRFPLRTEYQASISKIKQVAYTKEEVSKLLTMFIETAGDMMLFTQNIESIEIYHLGPHGQPGTDAVRIVSINKEVSTDGLDTNCQQYTGILQRMKTNRFQLISEIQILHISMNIFDTAAHVISDVNNRNTNCTWIVSWSTGESKAMSIAKVEKDRKSLPIAAVAVPCKDRNLQPCPLDQLLSGFHKSGRLFCFLPLPLECGLNMHINAYFDVTSDRRQLLSDSEDDKPTQTHQWNRALMTDAVVSAFLKLLVKVVETSSLESYYKLWPTTRPKFTDAFVVALYKNIVSSNLNIFKGDANANLCFSDVMFIDPKLREDEDIGNLCFILLKQFPPRHAKQVINIPPRVVRLLREINNEVKDDQDHMDTNQSDVERAIIGEEELILTYINSLKDPFWKTNMQMQNTFLIFALKSDSNKVKNKIESTQCIPTKPLGRRLRRPCELVDETCPIASLFFVDDERFLIEDPRFSAVIVKIKALGMIIEKLPSYLLLERCSHITQRAAVCCVCAYQLNLDLLQYLSRQDVQTDLDADEHSTIQTEYILPVLNKPKQWNHPWYSEKCENAKTFSCVCKSHATGTMKQLCLGQPNVMFRLQKMKSVGCVELVVDESDYKPTYTRLDALAYLKVQQNVPFKTVLKQLGIISSTYVQRNAGNDDMFKSCMNDIYSTLSSYLTTDVSPCDDEMKRELMSLSDSPVVLIDEELIRPSNIAFTLKYVCPPYTYRLPNSYLYRHRKLFQAFGVKEYFMVADIIRALEHEHSELLDKACTNINTIFRLLQNLEASMTREGRVYNDLQIYHGKIIAPDVTCVLRPTNELVVDDEEFETNQTIYELHPDIPRGLGEKLGVIPKKKKCRANISRGIPFGQREELVTRLQGLLKAYPCDSGIMKELIQNADDAGATEICFITDFSTHKEDRNFGCKMLNQPSLCVYNNSSFTEQDLQGIHNLGRGSKGGDPTKTGQYGVGFNAVYHLTDVPSFMTVGADLPNGGAMCIFDPLCNHIDDVTKHEPGIRCDINGLKSDFPDILSGFHDGKLLSNGVGTVFRFPLRQNISNISNNVITEETMNDIIEQLKKDMFDVLLFVKNVTSIKIMDVSSGVLEDKYVVRLELPEKDRIDLNSFHTYISQAATNNKDNKLNNLQIPSREVKYKATVSDSQGVRKNWLIVQRFGVNGHVQNEVHEQLSEAFNDNLIGLLPVGGIAIPLDDLESLSNQNDRSKKPKIQYQTYCNNGRAFCFLPLPVKTCLPVHINGHFALDHEARRGLWTEGYKEKWNDCILNHIVVPAWISGLIRLQTMYVESLVTPFTTWPKVNTVMNLYHSFFPRQQHADSYWAKCVRFFYEKTISKNHSLFPVVQRDDAQFRLFWCPLKSRESQFNGVFNIVEYFLPRQLMKPPFRKTRSKLRDRQVMHSKITSTLKTLGMKLLETPLEIQETIESLHLQIDKCSQEFTIDFLRSYGQGAGCCNIGGINGPVNASNYKSCDNLWHVVYFIHFDKDFEKKIDGLPIMLTADDNIRQCSNNDPVFASEYQDLLPGSSSIFLHKHLLALFPRPKEPPSEASTTKDEQKMKNTVVKKLTVNRFLELLPRSCDNSVYCAGRSVFWSEGSLVTPSWICRLFRFLYDKNPLNMKDTLQNLANWSFVPSIDQQNKQCLIPVHMFYTLFFKTKNTEEDNVLEKMLLPSLDLATLTQMKNNYLIEALIQCCCTIDYPDRVLKCLLHHKSRVHIPYESALVLLSYFDRHLQLLKDKESYLLISELCSIPMFITVQKTVVSIAVGSRVYVLPKIPSDGIDEWASNENVVLIQDSERYTDLLKYLNLTVQSEWKFYIDILLPTVTSMPDKYWKEHVAFIRDRLYYCSNLNEQERIINLLTNLPFVQSKCTRNYFNHEVPVFDSMLPGHCFLPKEYRTPNWMNFLPKIGLVTEVSDDHLVQFATQLQNEYANNINDEVIRKSNILLNSLVNRLYDQMSTGLFDRIKTISFIVPYKVSNVLLSYGPQFENASSLIRFDGSTLEKHQRLCWTSMHLIPKNIYGKLTAHMLRLGICNAPPLQKVISHCKQLCVSFKKQLEQENVSENCSAFVEKQMSLLYDHLNEDKYSINGQLNNFPIIYIPNIRNMVPAKRIVIEMKKEEEIYPYLVKAPKEYGKYFELFKLIGSQEDITCAKLVEILEEIYSKHKTERVIGSDLGVLSQIFSIFFRVLSFYNYNEDLNAIQHIYLLNRDKILCPSTDLWMNDKPAFRKRLEGKINLNWIIDFNDLDVKIPDLDSVVRKLPKHCRPVSLKEKITEEVCLNNIVLVESSHSVSHLELFLRSAELLEALVRLVKHESIMTHTHFDENTEQIINTKLKRIKCNHVIGLQTLLRHNGTVIDESQETKRCHISIDGEKTMFYFQLEEQTEPLTKLIDAPDGLFDLVFGCVQNEISQKYLFGVLQGVENPCNLKEYLDERNIPVYNVCHGHNSSAFPRPGTYVEDDMLPFLVNKIQPFSFHEYKCVAMAFDSSADDGSVETQYKYVHIIKCINNDSPLSIQYRVDCGETNLVNVQLWRLYRFVKPTDSETYDFGNEPENEEDFQRSCLEVQRLQTEAWQKAPAERDVILRRVFRHWCDGSYKDNDYARRVFNYSQDVALQLEHGTQVSFVITRQTGKSPPDTRGSFIHNISQSVRKVSRYHVNRYRKRRSRYRSYNHRRAEEVVTPDIKEAKMWLKQATIDFQAACAASENMTEVQADNWTCYKCHQASEKAMKAVLYSINANKVPNNSASHDLTCLASCLSEELRQEARYLMERLGEQSQLRYPDVVDRDRIPSNMFNKGDSDYAIEHTRRVIQLANEHVQ